MKNTLKNNNNHTLKHVIQGLLDKLVVDLYPSKEKSVLSCITQVYLKYHGSKEKKNLNTSQINLFILEKNILNNYEKINKKIILLKGK